MSREIDDFVERVATIRKAQGMTQEHLAERMRQRGHAWKQTTVSKVEAGHRPVSLVEAYDVALALNRHLRDFIEGESTMTLTEFLLARIAEDETAAQAAEDAPWQVEEVTHIDPEEWTAWWVTRPVKDDEDSDGIVVSYGTRDEGDGVSKANADHIVRHAPARVLAECEAKRRIVARCSTGREDWPVEHVQDDVLALLALPYADHPDFREEWRAETPMRDE